MSWTFTCLIINHFINSINSLLSSAPASITSHPCINLPIQYKYHANGVHILIFLSQELFISFACFYPIHNVSWKSNPQNQNRPFIISMPVLLGYIQSLYLAPHSIKTRVLLLLPSSIFKIYAFLMRNRKYSALSM